ncbi:MAG TPA: transposase [Candidatus Binatia bacterium]|nr:transposase [Candidatus Binatia bacterium]
MANQAGRDVLPEKHEQFLDAEAGVDPENGRVHPQARILSDRPRLLRTGRAGFGCVLTGITSASVQGRVALGPRAGARVLQLGREPDAPWVTSRGPCQAHLEGFDLHAAITVAADDRAALERLARYVLRPPVAQDRLTLTPEGQVLVTLKAEWADGTTHLLFEPVEFLERLAALTPRPRINRVVYHGILAPHARARGRAVARSPAASTKEQPPAPEDPAPALAPSAEPGEASSPDALPQRSPRRGPEKPCDWAWADLMCRVFDLDVLACPRCGARMSVIATIEAGAILRTILDHLGLPTEPPSPLPARPPPLPGDFFPDFPA